MKREKKTPTKGDLIFLAVMWFIIAFFVTAAIYVLVKKIKG